jgi:NodT family efflux transporter outer membrane factor (OMF) lipoprotein
MRQASEFRWTVAARRAGAAATVSMLAACASAPETIERSLAFATPKRFEAQSPSAGQPKLTRWWTRYGSRDLDRLMARAEARNLDIAAAVAQLEQAEAQAHVAGAALWPSVEGGGGASRQRSSGTMTPGVVTRTQGRNAFDATLSASYVVDVWGLNRDQLQAAIRSASASAYQIETVRVATQAALVDAFLTVAANRERARVAQENLRNAERVLGVFRARVAAGTASDLEIAQQTTLIENQRASLPQLRQAAEQARVQIALLTAEPVQAVTLATPGVTALRAPAFGVGAPSALLTRRPDIRAAEERLAAADADVSAARKALLPQIQLTAQGGLQTGVLSKLLRPESALYSLAAGLTQPIFDGGRLRAGVALTEAQRRELLETYRKAVVSALTDVEAALIAVRESAAREAGQARALASARRAFALSEERLRAGTIDLATLLNAQQSLFQAQDALVVARLARLQAAAQLAQALGGDWSPAAAQAIPEALAPSIAAPPPAPPPFEVLNTR